MPASDAPVTGGARAGGPRKDRVRNRALLLHAALEVFDEDGIGAPLTAVAARAGISMASLYRHFPGRDELLRALYDDRAADAEAVTIAVLEATEGEPGHRLDVYLEQLTRSFLTHPCIPALSARGAALYPDRPVEPRVFQLLEELRLSAIAAGELAADIRSEDLALIPTALASFVGFERMGFSAVWLRQLAIARRGLRPRQAGESPLPPLPGSL